MGKAENAGYKHFLLFQQCFPKPTSGSLKVWIVQYRVNDISKVKRSKGMVLYAFFLHIVIETFIT